MRIDRLSLGNPGQHRNLANGISEMKIDHGPGYRVYYTMRGSQLIVLLCGGDKTSQQEDIAKAIRIANAWET
jgi:putative addiction module killer protein